MIDQRVGNYHIEVSEPLQRLRILNPFLLRTALPPITAIEGRRVEGVERLGKRVVIAFEGELLPAGRSSLCQTACASSALSQATC